MHKRNTLWQAILFVSLFFLSSSRDLFALPEPKQTHLPSIIQGTRIKPLNKPFLSQRSKTKTFKHISPNAVQKEEKKSTLAKHPVIPPIHTGRKARNANFPHIGGVPDIEAIARQRKLQWPDFPS